MAYATSYSSLVSEVMEYVDDRLPEFQAQLPNIIARAQDQVQRDLDLTIWRDLVSHHLTAGSRLYRREEKWLKIHSIFVPGRGAFLDQRTPDYCRMFSKPGAPRVWAEFSDTHYIVGPVPIDNETTEVDALIKLPALSAGNEKNWITNNAGDLLFWMTLIGCESFLIAPERMLEFREFYAAALSGTQSTRRDTERAHYAPIRGAPRPAMRAPGS